MEAAGLAGRFDGSVLEPESAGYEEARSLFNAMIDRRPAVIAQCESADDVAAALAFARSEGLEVAIRAGGHSVAGASLVDGGLVIDMRRMNAVTVDPDARTATVQGGADLERLRPRQPAARPRDHRRPGLDHRRRRAHARRRLGLARAQVRPRLRQPPSVDLVTADGRTVTRQRGGEPGAVLGAARRRRQLRHRHRARLPPAPAAGASTFGAAALAAGARAGRSPALPDLVEAGAPDELGGGLRSTSPARRRSSSPMHLQGKLVRAVLRRLRRAGGRGRASCSRRCSSSSPRAS